MNIITVAMNVINFVMNIVYLPYELTSFEVRNRTSHDFSNYIHDFWWQKGRCGIPLYIKMAVGLIIDYVYVPG